MNTNYQYHNSIFNISTAICHIKDAHQKLFHIYFATRHHDYYLDWVYQDLRQLAKKTGQEIPGMIICKDYADSRSNKPIVKYIPHHHNVIFFVEHKDMNILVDKCKTIFPNYCEEYQPKTSIARTVQYATKIDGYETAGDGVI